MIDTTFPEPVVPSLPLDAGVFYDESLQNYDYKEELPNDIAWSFALGDANVRMFDRALGALFERLVPVDQPGGTGAPFDDLDVIIEPRIEAFEFSLPRQSRSDQYAVWIRYNLSVYTPDGEAITNWPISAYGQADAQLFGASGAMEAAVVRAMRDAIANIIIEFPEEPGVRAALFPTEAATGAAPTGDLAAEPMPRDESRPEDVPEETRPRENAERKAPPDDEIRS
ncbi:MAG: hypothetical protein ACE5G3_08415 [Gammaproteobacteria bacterium]